MGIDSGTRPNPSEMALAAAGGEHTDWPSVAAIALGMVLICAPLLGEWIEGALLDDRHELLILGVSLWLLFRLRGPLTALPPAQGWAGAALVLAIALLFSFAGRLLDIQALLMLSLLLSLASVLWLFKGLAALRLAWFPIVFLIFAYPLPYELVLWLTGPLKEGVSAVAAQLLSWLGFPVGHSGVVITIGQYQLLVLEACAGLQTMFTLEAMGLLYASLMNHQALARNLLLALVVVPISFVANVVRVMVLALITYEFGDAAGQGFLHGFAGVLLFLVALCLIVLVDDLLGRVLPAAERRT